MTRPVARPGFAALLAVCLLASVATLAVASFHPAVQARRSATRIRNGEDAAGAADLGLERLLGSWEAPQRDSLAIGGVDSVWAGSHADPAQFRAFVTRITPRLFWLESVGRAGTGTTVEATRVHHLLIEALRPTVPTSAALIARGPVSVGTGASIVGGDTPPPGWSGCPPPDTSGGAAIRVPDGVTAHDDDGYPIPGAVADAVAERAETYRRLGAVTVEQLGARADTSVSAGAILSQQRDTPMVVFAAGDLVVTGVGGRGVLLVDGRLSIRGPFGFAGVVIATGGIDASGPDVSVYGTVLAAGTEGVVWRGSGALRRSTCAVLHAAEGAARPFVIARRGWGELY